MQTFDLAVLVHEFDVDCDGPWSSAEYGSGPTARRTIDIEQSGTYRVYFTGVRMVSALACQLDVLVDRPEDDMAGDIVSETAGLVLPTFFAGDEPYEIQLEPGRLQLSFTIEGEASTVGFELRRLGP